MVVNSLQGFSKNAFAFWRLGLLYLLLGSLCIGAAQASTVPHPGNNQARYHDINIPELNAARALTLLAEQTQALFLFPYDIAESHPANAAKGSYTIMEALEKLLKNSGLKANLSEKGVIEIYRDGTRSFNEGRASMNSKKKMLASIVSFFVGSGGATLALAEEMDSRGEGWVLEEIVVTANKRETSLQDTAMSITALSAETIEKRGLNDMRDYLTKLPSVSLVEFEPDDNRIIIRGITTGPSDLQSTVGAYLGEMPLGASSFSFAADISLVDMARIEVLRGPQGTLYGSSGLSGVVRNVPMLPNLHEFGGSITADLSTQSESDDENYSIEGIVNIPLVEDVLGLRMAVYNKEDAGYVDAIRTQRTDNNAELYGLEKIEKEDINSFESSGVRASLLWQPTDSFDMNLILGREDKDGDGLSGVIVYVDDFLPYEVAYLNEVGLIERELDYKNLVLNYDLGWGRLTSSTSQVDIERYAANNGSNIIYAFGDELSGVRFSSEFDQDIFSQEIRLASSLDGPWSFLFGAFYEDVEVLRRFLDTWDGTAENPFGGSFILGDALTLTDYDQKALFGELTYSFSELWALTVGVRHFDYDREDSTNYTPDADGNYGAFANPGLNGTVDTTEDSGETYKANLSYMPDEDTLFYAQWSEGFRVGRGQTLPPLDLCDIEGGGPDGILDGSDAVLTRTIEPDTTENMELGAKLALFDKRFIFNAAIFRIDWDNLPVNIFSSSDSCAGRQVVNNVGEARSEGIEIETSIYIESGFTVNISGSYIDATYTSSRVGFSTIEEGDDLLFSPNASASLGLQYDFDFHGNNSFMRADLSYIGEYETGVNESLPVAGDYVALNLRLGAEKENWALSFYIDNVTDEDAITAQNLTETYGNRLRPRRIGGQIQYKF